MNKEQIQISIKDALKLISWEEIMSETGYDYYALNEGLDENTLINIPIDLIK